VWLEYPDPQLADEAVRLRPWSDDDLETVVEASRDPYIPKVTTVPAPYTKGEGRRWVERQLARQTSGSGLSLAIADGASDAALGGAVLIRRRAGLYGVGYWLVRPARGHGLASRAVALLVGWALGQPEVLRLEALVEPWNAASCRVVERVGFTRDRVLRAEVAAGGRRAEVVRYLLGGSDRPV
jgi:RimJ/RimL family protein N-acetyltransferase